MYFLSCHFAFEHAYQSQVAWNLFCVSTQFSMAYIVEIRRQLVFIHIWTVVITQSPSLPYNTVAFHTQASGHLVLIAPRWNFFAAQHGVGCESSTDRTQAKWWVIARICAALFITYSRAFPISYVFSWSNLNSPLSKASLSSSKFWALCFIK